MEEPSVVENWKRTAILGSGAFGIVSLWKNQVTNDFIAIKKCKFRTNTALTERQKSRWVNEVAHIKTLSHPNIVSFKVLDAYLEAVLLKHNPTDLPLLPMEYCRGGNLRHVLNQAKNSCGLPENDVRALLKDLMKAVAFLHRHNITHRDIKPDNVVLQPQGEGVVYKLIDLGYAKELNDTIVSYVGTLHYLAPEIMRTEKYDYKVDYWSMGVMAFEVMCGVLPFLPQFAPFERFQYIEKKGPDHICITQLLGSGSVVNSSTLLKEHHLSTCLQQNFELWLRHVLQYDPALRTTKFPDNLNVFDKMLNILNKTIINVFSVHTLEFYSYEIDKSTFIGTLKDWIARDTKVQKSEQILLATGQAAEASDDKFVADIISGETTNVFVFKKNSFFNKVSTVLPKAVKVVFENCASKYNWRDLRLLYGKCLCHLTRETKLVSFVHLGFNLYANYVKNLTMNLRVLMNDIHKDLSTLIMKTQCYNDIKKNNFSDSNNCQNREYTTCLQNFNKLMTNLGNCASTTNKLIGKVELLRHRQTKLDQWLPKIDESFKTCDMNKSVEDATALLEKKPSDKANSENYSCKEMCKPISESMKTKEKLLNSKMLQSYIQATSVHLQHVANLSLFMNNFKGFIGDLSKFIDDNEKEQFAILLAPDLSKGNNFTVVKGESEVFVNLDANVIIKNNRTLRYEFEEMLSRALFNHKKFCEEANVYLNEDL